MIAMTTSNSMSVKPPALRLAVHARSECGPDKSAWSQIKLHYCDRTSFWVQPHSQPGRKSPDSLKRGGIAVDSVPSAQTPPPSQPSRQTLTPPPRAPANHSTRPPSLSQRPACPGSNLRDLAASPEATTGPRLGETVTIKGWVRLSANPGRRRTSCFVAEDGTCFDPIQVVCKAAGRKHWPISPRSRTHHRLLGRGRQHWSPARAGPGRRDPRRRIRAERSASAGRKPRHLPRQQQAPHLRVPARGRAPARPHQHLRRGCARAPHAEHGDAPLL